MSLPRRCAKTGNPCGTDTRPIGHPCQCDACLAHAEIEHLRGHLSAAGINLTTASIIVSKLGSEDDAALIGKMADQVLTALAVR